MPSYEHLAKCCNREFEDFYSIIDNPPTRCPFCGSEGQVQRLISGGSGRGIVELSGQELKQKLRSEGEQLKKEALRDPNVLANLVGETKYHSNTLEYDKAKSERPKIRTSRK